ncbi:LysR family transcriptional regulator [Actinosynnema sp. NPDC023587]|uniref:LysR family transcriptional regulator n=1 Tax=Actinosynnema sp. NPDC023587 TaxID=3154695 RepID=UPI0033E7A7E6
MHLEIRHARVVMTLAEAGSISKAAARLSLPQPSLTAQLRRIEKAVGGDLFVRSAFGITPTPLGERLIPMLADLATRADAVVAEASSLSSGILRIGNAEWTPVALRRALQSSLPSVEVQTVTLDPAFGVDAVSRGELTAALVPSPEAVDGVRDLDPSLAKEIIVREPIWLALPRDHALARRTAVSRRHMVSLSWVQHVPGHWFHPVEEHLFRKLDHPTPEVLHYAGGHAEAMSWVRDAGVAALATPTGSTADVSLVAMTEPLRSRLLLVWRPGSIHPNTLRLLIDALRRYYCEYARTIPRYWNWMTERPTDFPELANFLPRPSRWWPRDSGPEPPAAPTSRSAST